MRLEPFADEHLNQIAAAVVLSFNGEILWLKCCNSI